MNANQIKILQDTITGFIASKSAVRGVNWTAANLVGNGLHVAGDLAATFTGCAGTVEDGCYFPTDKEVSNAIRKMPSYVNPDRTESGRGAFGRLGGSSRRAKYNPGYVRLEGASHHEDPQRILYPGLQGVHDQVQGWCFQHP